MVYARVSHNVQKKRNNNPKRHLPADRRRRRRHGHVMRFLWGKAEILYMSHIKFVLQGPKAHTSNATQKEGNKHAARTWIWRL